MGSAGAHPTLSPSGVLLFLITGSRYPQGTGLGLGMAFARELDATGALPGPIGLVPCAFGGSPLLRWEKREDGDPLHDKWEGRAPVNTHRFQTMFLAGLRSHTGSRLRSRRLAVCTTASWLRTRTTGRWAATAAR